MAISWGELRPCQERCQKRVDFKVSIAFRCCHPRSMTQKRSTCSSFLQAWCRSPWWLLWSDHQWGYHQFSCRKDALSQRSVALHRPLWTRFKIVKKPAGEAIYKSKSVFHKLIRKNIAPQCCSMQAINATHVKIARFDSGAHEACTLRAESDYSYRWPCHQCTLGFKSKSAYNYRLSCHSYKLGYKITRGFFVLDKRQTSRNAKTLCPDWDTYFHASIDQYLLFLYLPYPSCLCSNPT